MRKLLPYLVFLLVEAMLTGYVLHSGAALPDTVAAHFARDGQADGFLPRADYLAFMLRFMLGLPLLLVGGMALLWAWPGRGLRARRLLLQWHGVGLALLIALFLAYVHHLVLRANAAAAPLLPAAALWQGTAALVLALLAWGLWLPLAWRHGRE